jgi:PAS domain S-box-containing protein
LLTLFAGLMAAAGLTLAVLAAYVAWRRGTPTGWSLAAVLVAVAWWGLAYAIELSLDDLSAKSRWGDVKYVGICLLAPAWVSFVLQYVGRGRLVTPRLLGLLAVEPVVVLTLLALPRTHDLVRFYPPGAAGQAFPIVGTGPVFWVHLVYTNLVLLGATALFVASMVRLARSYRRMAVTLVVVALLPWVANFLHNLEVGWFARLDLTPFAFIVTGGVLVWGLFRERLVDLRPIARSAVVESMADAVFVVDVFGRLVDVNPAGAGLVGSSRAALVGKPLVDVLPDLPPETCPRAPSELTLGEGDAQRTFDVLHQSLSDAVGRPAGDLLVLREITDRVRDRERLRRILGEQSRVAAALQASMVPGRLPDLPGGELASRYQPAGDGGEVGGDFLDVFALDDQTWAIVLGDVSGKGAEAAAVAAAARYTLRALADSSRSPSETLHDVNARLLTATDTERYCTLVYAQVRTSGDGLSLTLSLAGHHQPLVRRADRTVEPVGRPGMALGLFESAELHDASLALGPDEVLCLFTDGLVESRREHDEFGSERVSELLAEHADDTLDELAGEMAGAARSFHGDDLADDLALLLLRVAPGGRAAIGRNVRGLSA